MQVICDNRFLNKNILQNQMAKQREEIQKEVKYELLKK